jgi:hypothetical protein
VVTGNFSFMLSELKFSRWVFAAVYVFLAVQSLAQGESQEFRKVVATGAGLDVDGALKNAFKVAVEEAVGTLVDTETMVRQDETIEEKILSASNGFIKHYDLIDNGRTVACIVAASKRWWRSDNLRSASQQQTSALLPLAGRT